ncbi:nucleoside recognition domain-containing protein [Porphyromonas sp.]|uniref:nucleoside recognition domain-containing protein n=1 Tax=Porphyromonas sp. TaxID=1924944 RepID=UPI0026DB3F32|nr:spore maturation protein [Porphyromonas sp.]MDO4771201.1 nucleoside recognition domain-containing protein [Porphyromonas sp.]
MLLNYIWISFFLIALVAAVIQTVAMGDTAVWGNIVEAIFGSAKTGFEISLGLTGVLTLWQGLLKVGERSGMVQRMSRATAPFFKVLFPEVPAGHPVNGTMLMNFSANLLGLDNAATPLGLEVMQQLQQLNKDKERASNAMIMFICINASGLTLIPITIIMYRIQLGSASPSDIFLPILLATGTSTLSAILMVAIRQRINLFRKAFVIPALIFVALIGLLFYTFNNVPKEELTHYSTLTSHVILFGFICLFILSGVLARRNVYEDFIDGAKDGFKTAVTIIPYLVAILVAIGVFRASGAMDTVMSGVSYLVSTMGLDTAWVDALPTMLMKPLSGGGARGLMIDAMQTHGADSFVGRLVCLVQGASDTTFYIIALYFGSIAIKRTRYALGVSLIADLIGIVTGIFLCYLFFG